jgi:hypothetical protein
MLCREVSWPCDAGAAVERYLRVYRDALDRPPVVDATTPALVERLRRSVPQEREAWLSWADSLMQPLVPEQEAASRQGLSRFARMSAQGQGGWPPGYYDVVRVGALRIGFGSALDKKVLFRVRGPTALPADDVILEARRVAPPRGNECVWRPLHGGSLHALLFMSILGPRMPAIYGFVPLEDDPGAPEFWVQAWDAGYRELSIADIESQAELEGMAEHAANQLAGHFWTRFPEPLRAVQRRAQLDAFDTVHDRARTLARDIAAETVTEWERFRARR